jgi:hypothetical protein
MGIPTAILGGGFRTFRRGLLGRQDGVESGRSPAVIVSIDNLW